MATSNKKHYFLNGAPMPKDHAARILSMTYNVTPTRAIKEFTTRARGYLRANRMATSYTDVPSGITYMRRGV